MRVLVAYRDIPGRRGAACGASVVRAIQKLGHDAQPYAKVYGKNEWLLPTWSLDSANLLLLMECCDSDPQYHELGSLHCLRCYWEFDTETHQQESADWIRYNRLDSLFMANKRMCAKFRAQYLPYAFDEELMVPIETTRNGAAIIGTAFPARQTFADGLGVPLVSGVFGKSYADAVCSLLVHVHHLDSGGNGLIVCRPWETMGLGTCLLTERTPELEELFTDGVHCVMYDDLADAETKLAALLADPQRTQLIGKQGREEVLAKHTYVDRMQYLLPRAFMVEPQ